MSATVYQVHRMSNNTGNECQYYFIVAMCPGSFLCAEEEMSLGMRLPLYYGDNDVIIQSSDYIARSDIACVICSTLTNT